MKQPVFVVISGKKQHGKNFFTDKVKALLRQERISFTETAFAAPIKKFVNDVFGIPMEDMETQEGKMKPTHLRWCDINLDISAKFGKLGSELGQFLTIRELLQIIGTEVFREGFYGPIWAEAPFRREYKRHIIYPNEFYDTGPEYESFDVVFITDCRFPNEVEEALKHRALLVRVVRDDIEDDKDAHSSETALDNYDWAHNEVVVASTDDGRLDAYAKNILLPKIKGLIHGH